ncbi:hypothetical protein DFH07DRAFT_774200 [Mycena maculata]|uniref:MYND-type domain-containing protein n=1 Tax=Mycena maculata TaxID=230809 RepID=A0AAD7J1D1_9AGAR|nr:hypothetical protein DFH07DRAFT_774200 [Mycena maculata]
MPHVTVGVPEGRQMGSGIAERVHVRTDGKQEDERTAGLSMDLLSASGGASPETSPVYIFHTGIRIDSPAVGISAGASRTRRSWLHRARVCELYGRGTCNTLLHCLRFVVVETDVHPAYELGWAFGRFPHSRAAPPVHTHWLDLMSRCASAGTAETLSMALPSTQFHRMSPSLTVRRAGPSTTGAFEQLLAATSALRTPWSSVPRAGPHLLAFRAPKSGAPHEIVHYTTLIGILIRPARGARTSATNTIPMPDAFLTVQDSSNNTDSRSISKVPSSSYANSGSTAALRVESCAPRRTSLVRSWFDDLRTRPWRHPSTSVHLITLVSRPESAGATWDAGCVSSLSAGRARSRRTHACTSSPLSSRPTLVSRPESAGATWDAGMRSAPFRRSCAWSPDACTPAVYGHAAVGFGFGGGRSSAVSSHSRGIGDTPAWTPPCPLVMLSEPLLPRRCYASSGPARVLAPFVCGPPRVMGLAGTSAHERARAPSPCLVLGCQWIEGASMRTRGEWRRVRVGFSKRGQKGTISCRGTGKSRKSAILRRARGAPVGYEGQLIPQHAVDSGDTEPDAGGVVREEPPDSVCLFSFPEYASAPCAAAQWSRSSPVRDVIVNGTHGVTVYAGGYTRQGELSARYTPGVDVNKKPRSAVQRQASTSGSRWTGHEQCRRTVGWRGTHHGRWAINPSMSIILGPRFSCALLDLPSVRKAVERAIHTSSLEEEERVLSLHRTLRGPSKANNKQVDGMASTSSLSGLQSSDARASGCPSDGAKTAVKPSLNSLTAGSRPPYSFRRSSRGRTLQTKTYSDSPFPKEVVFDIIDAVSNKYQEPDDMGPTLCSRIWSWIFFMHEYREYLGASSVFWEPEAYTRFLLFVADIYDPQPMRDIISATRGLRVFLATTWTLLPKSSRAAYEACLYFFVGIIGSLDFTDPLHFAEMVDGAGACKSNREERATKTTESYTSEVLQRRRVHLAPFFLLPSYFGRPSDFTKISMAPVSPSHELEAFCHQCQVTRRVDELKLCSRCQSAKYCSRACQVAHWKTHKAHCRSPEEVNLETDDNAWKSVFTAYGHKKTGVLEPVAETLVQQSVRLQAWKDKWGPTILNWALWAMNIPSSSTREDKLTKFTFMFELQRRPNPLTPEHYFEMHGAEIMHTSEVIDLLTHMKRTDILEEWQKIPRRKDTIQIMVLWKGHIIYLERLVSNFDDLRKKARDDPTLLGYDALAKNWVEELRKAIDSADPDYHQKFYNRVWGGVAAEASFVSGLIAMSKALEKIRSENINPPSPK